MPDDEATDSNEALSSAIVERARYEAAMAIIRYHEDPEGFYQEASSFAEEFERYDRHRAGRS